MRYRVYGWNSSGIPASWSYEDEGKALELLEKSEGALCFVNLDVLVDTSEFPPVFDYNEGGMTPDQFYAICERCIYMGNYNVMYYTQGTAILELAKRMSGKVENAVALSNIKRPDLPVEVHNSKQFDADEAWKAVQDLSRGS